MNRLLAALNLIIAGYFIFTIIRHMVRPGDNTGYTRMLMFTYLAAIPFVFLLGFAGGRDRWPYLLDIARDIAGPGWYAPLAVVGLAAVTILLPLAIFVAVFIVMELRSAFLFALYFIPVLVRLALSTKDECIMSAVVMTMLFLFTGPVGAGIVALLGRHKKKKLVESYSRHVRKTWRGYDSGSSANMFMGACLFALCSQMIELGRAIADMARENSMW
jgi:hypothetical protein